MFNCVNVPCHVVQATFERREGELKEITNNSEVLKRNFVELTELKCVLQSAADFFQDVSTCSMCRV